MCTVLSVCVLGFSVVCFTDGNATYMQQTLNFRNIQYKISTECRLNILCLFRGGVFCSFVVGMTTTIGAA